MRGEGQIAELVAIAEPDVGVIVNVGPVHLELLGTVERVAAAKAELIRDLRAGRRLRGARQRAAARRAPARDDLDTWTFGPGGEVRLLSFDGRAGRDRGARRARRSSSSATREPHNLLNTLAAVAAARALGRRPSSGRVDVQLLLAARRGRGAARRRDGGQRLLQRQPDVDARRPRPPGRQRRRAPDRGARRRWPSSARTSRALPPRDRRARRRARASTCS